MKVKFTVPATGRKYNLEHEMIVKIGNMPELMKKYDIKKNRISDGVSIWRRNHTIEELREVAYEGFKAYAHMMAEMRSESP